MERLKESVIRPMKHVLNNECSTEFTQEIKEHELEYKLAPTGQHRRNLAERTVKTWKAHTIGAINGVSDKFPLGLWDELLSQLDMQLNL